MLVFPANKECLNPPLIIRTDPTRGRRTWVSLRTNLIVTEVDIPLRQSLWSELICFGWLQERSVVAHKCPDHLDRMAVRTGCGATHVQIAKASDKPLSSYSPGHRIGIKSLEVVPFSRDRA